MPDAVDAHPLTPVACNQLALHARYTVVCVCIYCMCPCVCKCQTATDRPSAAKFPPLPFADPLYSLRFRHRITSLPLTFSLIPCCSLIYLITIYYAVYIFLV